MYLTNEEVSVSPGYLCISNVDHVLQNEWMSFAVNGQSTQTSLLNTKYSWNITFDLVVFGRQSHEWPYRHSCIRISNDKLKSQQSLPCRHRSPLQMLTGTLLPNQMPLLSIQHSSFCAEKHNTNSHDWKHKVGSKLIAFPCINEHNAYAVIFVNSPDHQC